MRRSQYIGIGGSIATGAFIAAALLVSSGQYVPGNGPDISQQFDPNNFFDFREDFTQTTAATAAIPTLMFTGTNSGTTSVSLATGIAGHPGIMSITTSTGATDGDRAFSTFETFGNVPKCVDFSFRLNNVPTSADWYAFRIGYARFSSITADEANSAVLEYHPSTANTFVLDVNKAGARTAATCTGVTPTAATFYTGSICADSVAGVATTVVLKLAPNGTTPAVCATVNGSANIPQGLAQVLGFGWQISNDTGSVPIAQLWQIDYIRSRYPFSPTR